jgi:polysaccharide export outer membrane protein
LDAYAENPSGKEYTIGPEDVINIQIWDNEDLNRTVEVSQDGSFTLPLIDKVRAAGLSVFELENLIKKRLADGYIVAPQVTVAVEDYQSQKVFLLGEVTKPGSYVLKGTTHILELISMAGGFTDKSGRIIKIERLKSLKHNKKRLKSVKRNKRENAAPREDRETETITLDLGKYKADSAYDSFFVANGDSIYVNPVPRIYVIGEVRRPGEFKWESDLTIHQVISRAGGPNEKAAMKRIKIIRIKKNGKEKTIRARMDDLTRPEDIIKVPGRYF